MLFAVTVTLLGSVTPTVNHFDNQVPGSYIVRVNDGVSNVSRLATTIQRTYGGQVDQVNSVNVPTIVFSGWTEKIANKVAALADVDFVDENALLKLTDTQQLRATADLNPSLDRLDQRESVSDRRFRYPFDGTGMVLYVVDTGVKRVGTTMSVRVLTGKSFVGGNAYDDNDGHGTAMASLAAGSVVGVAKQATIVPVRVVDTGLINLTLLEDGLRWVLTQQPGIVNLSLGVTTSATNTTVEQLVNQLHARGFVIITSAGNENADTSNVVPARVPAALTVGAMSVNTNARWVDSSSTGSNYGSAIDLFAPGVDVKAETPSGTTALSSGTSGAAAYTSGVAAALGQTGNLTPTDATSLIATASTPDVLSNLNGSANRLLFSDIRGSTVAAGNLTPAQVYCTWGAVPQWRSRNVWATSTVADAAGNMFIAYISAVPYSCFDLSIVTAADIVIEKRSSAGAILWTRNVTSGASLTENVTRLALNAGDLYLTGTTSDCGGAQCASTAGLVARLSGSTGAVVWTRRFDSAGTETANGLQFSGTSVDVVGNTTGLMGASSFGASDVFVARVNQADGLTPTNIGILQFGSAGDDVASDLTTFNQQLIVAGSTTGTLGAGNLGGRDAFVAAVVLNGGVVFVRTLVLQFGTAADDEASAAFGTQEVLSNGTVPALFVAGRTRGAFPGFANQGDTDAFHARINDSNTFDWLFQHGTSGTESLPQLAAGPDDLFIAAGSYVLKASRVSGLTAWRTTEATPRTIIAAEPTRHIYTASQTAFDRRRVF